MVPRNYAVTALAPLALGLLAGCDQGTAPGGTQPVNISLASTVGGTAAGTAPLVLSEVRIVIGEVSLGEGDQFGCVDCQHQGAEFELPPALVAVPLDGGAVTVTTEQVQPGSYPAVEISLVRPTAALLAGNSGWRPDATIELRGAYDGRPFTLPLAIEGSFRERLSPPVVVSQGGAQSTVEVTITLPVTSWVAGPTGPLDPNDPAQRAEIEANARRSFAAPETESESPR